MWRPGCVLAPGHTGLSFPCHRRVMLGVMVKACGPATKRSLLFQTQPCLELSQGPPLHGPPVAARMLSSCLAPAGPHPLPGRSKFAVAPGGRWLVTVRTEAPPGPRFMMQHWGPKWPEGWGLLAVLTRAPYLEKAQAPGWGGPVWAVGVCTATGARPALGTVSSLLLSCAPCSLLAGGYTAWQRQGLGFCPEAEAEPGTDPLHPHPQGLGVLLLHCVLNREVRKHLKAVLAGKKAYPDDSATTRATLLTVGGAWELGPGGVGTSVRHSATVSSPAEEGASQTQPWT